MRWSSFLPRLRGAAAPAPADGPDPSERLRPSGDLVWIHAAGAGTARAISVLVQALSEEDDTISVVVTGIAPDCPDLAGADILVADLGGDRATQVRAFLDTWRPDLGLLAASAMAGTLVAEAAERQLPLFVLCDTLPRRIPRRTLRRFRTILVTDREHEARLRKAGVPADRILLTGPLHQEPPVPGCNETERENLARLLTGRPTWLAAGITAAEDAIIVAAHATAARSTHRLLLILVPDDPARGPFLAARLRETGWCVALRSADEEPEEETQIYVADTEGEAGLWYRLSPVAFLGGTLARADPAALVDPAAAAALGSAILHGPQTGPFSEYYERLDTSGATRTVNDDVALAGAVERLIAPEAAAALAIKAWEVSTAGADTTRRIVERIIAALDDRVAG